MYRTFSFRYILQHYRIGGIIMSNKLRRWELASFLFAAAAGPLLHFTYQWSGENAIVAAFSAVNESTWEHMKLLFVPMFLFSLAEMAVLTDQYRNFLAAKAASILLGLVLIPTLYYTYTGVWGQSHMALDIAVFYIALAVAHWVGLRLLQRGRLTGGALQIAALLGLWALAFLFVWFTYRPPHIALFLDLAGGFYGLG